MLGLSHDGSLLLLPCDETQLFFFFIPEPCSGVLWTQKFKTHLLRTQSSDVLVLKPGVGQYIAMHTMPTARAFFLANFYPPSPFTCIFTKTSPKIFMC